jgi:aminopeptidase N
MKKFFTLIILILGTALFAQEAEVHIHDRYCRHYPRIADFPAYAYRNDWQSDFVHDYDVTFYWLDIEVGSTTTAVSGKVTIKAEVVAEIFETFAFELVDNFTIDSVVFNNQTITEYDRVGDNVLVEVPAMNAGDTFTAEIYYGGTPPSGSGFFNGVSNGYSNTWGKSVTWTLSEPFNAKHWFPVKQVLPDKADSVWVYLTTIETEIAASQGLLTNITNLDNGKHRFEWKSKYPIAYYLISFAVADYQEYNIYAKPAAMAGDSVLVQNFIYSHPNYLPTYQNDIDKVVPMIELFSDLYSLYPFWQEKYGHAITQMGGGMEHQTMSTMGGWSFNLVAHELGHMWFGDNVTCATWSDIWINEGFATYSSYLAFRELQGSAAGNTFMVSTQNNVMSQPDGSVYVPPSQATPDNVWRIFNGRLSYDKGAAILHVLRHEINNDDLFFEVFQTFQEVFKDSTATGDDFRMVADQVTGMDFEQFFNQWYYGEGYPLYDIVWYPNGGNLHMAVTQTTSTSVTDLFEMTMEYKVFFDDGTNELVRLFQDENLKEFIVPFGKTVIGIQVDPNNWTFEKVNSVSVGMQETTNASYFSFHPNPVHDLLHVYLLNDAAAPRSLRIADLQGRVLVKQHFSGKKLQLNVSDLPKGVYLLQVHEGDVVYSRKLIK